MQQIGIVKWFSRDRGYGFIESPESGEDVFVHFSKLPGQPGERNASEGDTLIYDEQVNADTGKLYALSVESITRSRTGV